MDSELRTLIKGLRSLNNKQRLIWILENYPVENFEYSYVYNIIPHFSWGKKERKKMMEYYLVKLPFVSKRPYEVFLKISPLEEFLNALSQIILSRKGEDLSLLQYHLTWVFKPYLEENNDLNKEKIDKLMALFC